MFFIQSGNAQKAFSFLPNLQTRAIHLDDTIKYDFIFNNTLNKDYRLVHQGQLRGLEIRYRFKKYQKWKPFSNSGADWDDALNLYGFNTYLIKENKSYTAKKSYYYLPSDSIFIKKYSNNKNKNKSIRVKFCYDPFIVLSDSSVEKMVQNQTYIRGEKCSKSYTISILPYKGEDEKAINWILKQGLSSFFLLSYQDFDEYHRYKYHKNVYDNKNIIEQLYTFYKLFPTSQFMGKAKLFEAGYFRDNLVQRKIPLTDKKSYTIFWEIVEGNYPDDIKRQALQCIEAFFPIDTKLENFRTNLIEKQKNKDNEKQD